MSLRMDLLEMLFAERERNYRQYLEVQQALISSYIRRLFLNARHTWDTAQSSKDATIFR
jgi:hypothetical protein